MTFDLFTHAITTGAEDMAREIMIWTVTIGIVIGWVLVAAVAAVMHANHRRERT